MNNLCKWIGMNEWIKEWMDISNVYFIGCFNIWFSWYIECRCCCGIVIIWVGFYF